MDFKYERRMQDWRLTYLIRSFKWLVLIFFFFLRCFSGSCFSFSFFIFQLPQREIINRCSGALVRTKLASSNEGGVTAGYSCLSTPYLT
mmetsp:Transcript_11164/g.28678  ORF Transcript_11164/g.28678 Transcript_11164/m.28678 type:complete len:89 (-) Transcript_11164:1027-1293(-)